MFEYRYSQFAATADVTSRKSQQIESLSLHRKTLDRRIYDHHNLSMIRSTQTTTSNAEKHHNEMDGDDSAVLEDDSLSADSDDCEIDRRHQTTVHEQAPSQSYPELRCHTFRLVRTSLLPSNMNSSVRRTHPASSRRNGQHSNLSSQDDLEIDEDGEFWLRIVPPQQALGMSLLDDSDQDDDSNHDDDDEDSFNSDRDDANCEARGPVNSKDIVDNADEISLSTTPSAQSGSQGKPALLSICSRRRPRRLGESNNHKDAPFVSILPLHSLARDLSSTHRVAHPALTQSVGNCFLCLDVDGKHVSIKDLRLPEATVPPSQGNHSNTEQQQATTVTCPYEFRIAREGQSLFLRSSMELLPRRQARKLYHGDRLCIYSINAVDAPKIVLEYRYDIAIHTSTMSVPPTALSQLSVMPGDETYIQGSLLCHPIHIPVETKESILLSSATSDVAAPAEVEKSLHTQIKVADNTPAVESLLQVLGTQQQQLATEGNKATKSASVDDLQESPHVEEVKCCSDVPNDDCNINADAISGDSAHHVKEEIHVSTLMIGDESQADVQHGEHKVAKYAEQTESALSSLPPSSRTYLLSPSELTQQSQYATQLATQLTTSISPASRTEISASTTPSIVMNEPRLLSSSSKEHTRLSFLATQSPDRSFRLSSPDSVHPNASTPQRLFSAQPANVKNEGAVSAEILIVSPACHMPSNTSTQANTPDRATEIQDKPPSEIERNAVEKNPSFTSAFGSPTFDTETQPIDSVSLLAMHRHRNCSADIFTELVVQNTPKTESSLIESKQSEEDIGSQTLLSPAPATGYFLCVGDSTDAKVTSERSENGSNEHSSSNSTENAPSHLGADELIGSPQEIVKLQREKIEHEDTAVQMAIADAKVQVLVGLEPNGQENAEFPSEESTNNPILPSLLNVPENSVALDLDTEDLEPSESSLPAIALDTQSSAPRDSDAKKFASLDQVGGVLYKGSTNEAKTVSKHQDLSVSVIAKRMKLVCDDTEALCTVLQDKTFQPTDAGHSSSDEKAIQSEPQLPSDGVMIRGGNVDSKIKEPELELVKHVNDAAGPICVEKNKYVVSTFISKHNVEDRSLSGQVPMSSSDKREDELDLLLSLKRDEFLVVAASEAVLAPKAEARDEFLAPMFSASHMKQNTINGCKDFQGESSAFSEIEPQTNSRHDMLQTPRKTPRKMTSTPRCVGGKRCRAICDCCEDTSFVPRRSTRTKKEPLSEASGLRLSAPHPSPQFVPAKLDFVNEDNSKPIRILITGCDLSTARKKLVSHSLIF
jgi:hypothetical protein